MLAGIAEPSKIERVPSALPPRAPVWITFYLLLAASIYVFVRAYPVLSPILFSLLLIMLVSMALNPVVSRLRVWTGGRKRSAILLMTGFLVLATITSWAFFGPLYNSTRELRDRFPEYWARLQKPLIKMEKQATISEEKLQKEVATEVAAEAAEAGVPEAAEKRVKPKAPLTPPAPQPQTGFLRNSLTHALQGFSGGIRGMVANVTQIVIVLVTVFFGVLFTLLNPRPVFGAIFAIVPERHHARTLKIVQRIGKLVPDWAMATLLAMLVVGLLVFLLMWPLLGFMDALVLGLIACVFEAVPYIGPILSAVPALLFALSVGGMTPFWVLLAYLAVQALENNVISPVIMARGMKLHPVAVIFSMLLCVVAFGVLGALIAAPMVGIVKVLHEEIYRARFLPHVTDDELEHLAAQALRERPRQ